MRSNIFVFGKKEEIKSILTKINQIDSSAKFRWFAFGMLEKYLFSCV